MKKLMKVLYSCRERVSHSAYYRTSYISTPKISMEGKWLEAIGFEIGSQIEVTYQDNEIIIRPYLPEENQLAMVCEPEAEYKVSSRKTSKKPIQK